MMSDSVLVGLVGLYRHFKGQYYYVTSVSTDATDEKTKLVTYFNVCHPEYGSYTRPVSDFLVTHDEKGVAIADRKDNTTGMTTRFERVKDLNFQIGSLSTQQLISELRWRKDSPIHEIDIEGLRSNIFAKDFVIGDKYYADGEYPCGVSTVSTFETEEQARKYYETHKHRRATSLFKRVFIEIL